MKDRKEVEREWRRARTRRVLRKALSYLALGIGAIAAVYYAYDIPTSAKRNYDILVRDLEWRRARLERPYREVEDTLGTTAQEWQITVPEATAPGAR